MEDCWYEERKKAKKWAIVGLVMALVAIAIDWFYYTGIAGTWSAEGIGEGFTYGFIVEFILFPMMIVGLVIFVVNLYRFIKYKNS